MNTQRRSRDEQSGAVAIMVALMALMLMIVAALSVDLGNAWARGRVVQKQADLAAIAAGSLLPMTTSNRATIEQEAADYLNKNLAQGQVSADYTLFHDGNLANGEAQFYDLGGGACDDSDNAANIDPCVQLTLTAPQAYVTFGLAGTIKSGVDIVRSATVQKFSLLPPKKKVVPLWLPSGCGYGPVDGDTSGGSGPSSPTSSTTSASSTTTISTSTSSAATSASAVAISPVGTHQISGSNLSVAAGSSLTIDNWSIINLASNTAKASVRLVSPDGTIYIEYATSTNVPHGSMPVATFSVSSEVTNTPGTWKAYAMAQENGANKAAAYSGNYLTVTVTGTPPTSPTTAASTTATATASDTSVPVGCVGQDRGNFGQLLSPRKDSTIRQTILAMNMADGLDHTLTLYPGTLSPSQKECADKNGNNVILPEAQIDNVSRDRNNCIIADSGNDGPAFYDGLIGGVSSFGKPGRLDVVNGHTRAGCDGRTDLVIGGKTINNDVLSCYLQDGATLSDLMSASADPSMLDQAILKSPRLVYLPVVLATDRAQKGYQPMVGYVAGFITDEDVASAATSANGLTLNGNSVKTIRIFVFNRAALADDITEENEDYDKNLGDGVVRLVG